MNRKNTDTCIWNNNSRYKPDNHPSITDVVVEGGAGFFGEVRGPCGWKDSAKYDCCFSKCRSKWKTRLYPLNVSL